MAAFALLLASGCEAPTPISEANDHGTSTDGDTASDVDTGTDGDADGDADTDTGTETEPTTDPDPDCDDLPAAPETFEEIAGVTSGTAMAFGGDGVLVTAVDLDLDRTERNEASAAWIPGSGCVRGLAALPTGDFVCCGADTVYLFDRITGTRRTVVSGLRDPVGLAVGRKGEVYAAERAGGDVLVVNPYTGASHVVADGLSSPSAITADAARGVLYVNTDCHTVYEMTVGTDGAVSEPALMFSPQQGPGADACLADLAVDGCGNLYALTAGGPQVLRVSPEVRIAEVFADLRPYADAAYDFEWGPGLGGFRDDALYVICSGDVLLELAIPGWSIKPSPGR